MTRLFRLLSPGITFAILGLIVFAESKWSWLHLRGGLVTVGLYALALQIVLSALLISAIDDLSGGGLWHRVGRGGGELLMISARPISFSRGLVEFYRRPFWPVCLLGFGLGASLSALAAGSFHETSLVGSVVFGPFGTHRSEAALGVILVLGAALLWWRGGRSYFGWTVGVSLAVMVGEIVFVPATNDHETIVGWSGLMIGLCLLRLLVMGTARIWSVGFSLHRPGEER